MAWVGGSEDRTFVVEAPYEEVVDYFCDPARFKVAFSQLEKGEEVEENTWRWVLREKAEKGITFKPDYTVRYQREGDTARWETVRGNMRSKGSVSFRKLGDERTEVHYTEEIESDLPIPRLAARVFKPIVAREVRGGIGDFLDRSTAHLEGRS